MALYLQRFCLLLTQDRSCQEGSESESKGKGKGQSQCLMDVSQHAWQCGRRLCNGQACQCLLVSFLKEFLVTCLTARTVCFCLPWLEKIHELASREPSHAFCVPAPANMEVFTTKENSKNMMPWMAFHRSFAQGLANPKLKCPWSLDGPF